MNERIKQLAEQAEKLADEHTKAFTDGTGEWKHSWNEVYDEKFAELIVRECMAQCEQVAQDADAMAKSTFVTDVGRMIHEGAWGGAKNCGVQIQTHFGVEE
jgi:hypothetical protein